MDCDGCVLLRECSKGAGKGVQEAMGGGGAA